MSQPNTHDHINDSHKNVNKPFYIFVSFRMKQLQMECANPMEMGMKIYHMLSLKSQPMNTKTTFHITKKRSKTKTSLP